MSLTSITEITSRQNERIKHLVKLRQRKERDRQGCFLVEGFWEVTRLRASGRRLRSCFFCEPYLRTEASLELIVALAEEGVECIRLTESVFDKIGYREGSDGLIALADTWEVGLDALVLSACPLLIVAESIEKPGNLGSLIRTAEAVNADALIVCDPVTDLFNPNVVRASRGLLCTRPFAVDKPESVFNYLKKNKIQMVALMPEAKSVYWNIDWCQPSAVVVGSEWAGLSHLWESQADYTVALPMLGAGDSLNVSVAAAIALYEALRQRQ